MKYPNHFFMRFCLSLYVYIRTLLIIDSIFVPSLVYTAMGSSRDLAVETVAVVSMLLGSLLGSEVSAADNPHITCSWLSLPLFLLGSLKLYSASSST